ncbi:MAG: OadG family protein [Clostridiales bacterium]|nr:OadG family protein [Clostridiales bacterium]
MGNFFLGELVDANGLGYGVNNLTVILMGIGIVFAGLIGLIIVCSVMGAICKAVIKEKPKAEISHAAAAPAAETIPDRGPFIAAVSAAIAEASGTDASGIRIVKIEKK